MPEDMNQNEPVNKKDELLSAISEMDVDMDRTICLTDAETGEDIAFIVNDTFNMNGKEYIVLLQPTEDPDADYEYVIMESVTINGEVLYPNTVRFKEGKSAKYYIKQAGGATSTAKKSKAIIIYMNGMVAKANSKNRPKPGCQIVVPTKRKGHGLSLPELMAIGNSSASIGTMMATIANVMK